MKPGDTDVPTRGAQSARAPAEGRPLRILFALEAAGGGSARHVLDLAGGLLQRGHAVHLAWSPLRAEPAFVAAVRSLPGLVSHEVPMRRAPGAHDFGNARALRRILGRHGPFDVAHGHSSKAGALLRLAAAGTGVPVFYTPHAFVTLDPGLPAAMRALYHAAEWLLAPLGARIICVSDEERDHAIALGIARSRLAVVPNGLAPLPPADRAAQRQALGLSADEVCVGFVGRLSAQKAADRLVGAFAVAVGGCPRARLVLVGDGPDRSELEAQAHRLGVGSRVVFTGHGDGPSLMAAFDVFVLPSRYEGFPYALLEAAARGLPILSTQVGGASAVVRSGENGYVISQADAAGGLARHLAGLLADADARGRMSRRSLEMAGSLGVDQMVARTLELYRAAAQPDQ